MKIFNKIKLLFEEKPSDSEPIKKYNLIDIILLPIHEIKQLDKDTILKIENIILDNRLNFSSLDFGFLINHISSEFLVMYLKNTKLNSTALLDAYYNVIKDYSSNNVSLLKFLMPLIIVESTKKNIKGYLLKITVESLKIHCKNDFLSFFSVFYNNISQKDLDSALTFYAQTGRSLDNTLENLFYFILYSKQNQIEANWNLLFDIIEDGAMVDKSNNYYKIRKILDIKYICNFNFFNDYNTSNKILNQPKQNHSDCFALINKGSMENLISIDDFCLTFFGSNQKKFKKFLYSNIIGKNLINYDNLIWGMLFQKFIKNHDDKFTIINEIIVNNKINIDCSLINVDTIFKYLTILIEIMNVDPKKIIYMFICKKNHNITILIDSISLINRISPYLIDTDNNDIDVSGIYKEIKNEKTIELIHDVLLKYNHRIKSRNFRLNQDNILSLDGLKINKSLKIYIPQTNNDLFECGDNLRICIGTAGYGEIVSRSIGQRIALLMKDTEFYGAIHFTADYNVKAIEVHQSKLYRNEEMPEDILQEFIKICERTIF